MYSNQNQPPLQYPGQSNPGAGGAAVPPSGQPYGNQMYQTGPQYGAPSQTGQPYGAPSQTGQPYGAPSQTGQPYGAPSQTGQPYGAQSQAGQQYGAPSQTGQPHGAPSQAGQPYGTPSQGGQQYGAPSQTGQPHGTPSQAGQQYGTPSQAGQQYGAPSQAGQQYGAPSQTGQPHGAPSQTGQPYGSSSQTGQPYGAPGQTPYNTSSYQSGKHPQGGPSQHPGQPYGSSPNSSGQGYGGWPNSGPDTEVMLWFQAVDADGSGRIEAKELKQALTNGNWSHFSDDACRLMIGMFDRDQTKSIDVNEFQQLWRYLQEWRQVYSQVDKDRSGYIEHGELHQALTSMGYQLSGDFIRVAIDRFNITKQHRVNLDSFIVCCVLMHQLTEVFKQKDTERKGEIRISYEEFMHMAISGIP